MSLKDSGKPVKGFWGGEFSDGHLGGVGWGVNLVAVST